ncbi:hypothetical protein Taro_042394 [Colocasia esculenta]|uniref:Uncharacterized protein n=1 Tax=Colocasia esculenta TaxID=4460 RepID=A0A843WPG7_COLES|nr:hypothetical protein [Colocasia esculenta]
MLVPPVPLETANKQESDSQKVTVSCASLVDFDSSKGASGNIQSECAVATGGTLPSAGPAGALQVKGPGRKTATGETSRGRGRKQSGLGSVTHGRTRASRNGSPAIAPTINHEVDPMSGLQKVAELSTEQGPSSLKIAELSNVQGHCSSSGTGKHEVIPSASDNVVAGKGVQVTERTEVPLVLTESVSTVHGPTLSQPKKSDLARTNIVQSMQESVPKKATPSVLEMKDAKEKSLLAGSIQTRVEKLKLDESSGNISLQSIEKAVPVDDRSPAVHLCKASEIEIPNPKSVENVRSQDTLLLSNSPAVMPIIMKHDTVVAMAPLDQTNKRDIPTPVVRRGSEKKTSLTRQKAAAREAKSKGSSVRTACRGNAQLSGSGLLDRKESTSKSVTVRDKSDDGGKQEQTITGKQEKSLTFSASSNLERNGVQHVPNVLSAQKEHLMGSSEISTECHKKLKPPMAGGNATCSNSAYSSSKKNEFQAVEDDVEDANTKLIVTQSSHLSEVKPSGLLDAFNSSQAGRANLQAPLCNEQAQMCSIDNDPTCNKTSPQNIPSDSKYDHISDNSGTVASNTNDVETGGKKVFTVDTSSEPTTPLSAIQVSKTTDSSAEVPTDQHEENIAKLTGVIEPPRAHDHMLPPGPSLQTPEKAKETACGESDGILMSACTDHPLMFANLHRIEREKDIDQTNAPIGDVGRESAHLAGDIKDTPPVESSMDKGIDIPPSLEAVKIGEMPVTVDEGRETELENTNVDISNASGAVEFHQANVQETIKDPACEIHRTELCGTSKNEDGNRQTHVVPDLSLAGCSHVADMTIREIQSLEEGCSAASAGVLGAESTENQPSPGAATVSQAIQKEGLDNSDASNRKVETIREECVVADLCCTTTMNEDVVNEKYAILDHPLAGSSPVTEETIKKAQLLEEGCPTGDLGIESTESQSSPGAAAVPEASQEEVLAEPDADNTIDGTVGEMYIATDLCGTSSSRGDVIGDEHVFPDLPLPGSSHVVDRTIIKIQSLEAAYCSTAGLQGESTESQSSTGGTAVFQVSEKESLGDSESKTVPGVDNAGGNMVAEQAQMCFIDNDPVCIKTSPQNIPSDSKCEHHVSDTSDTAATNTNDVNTGGKKVFNVETSSEPTAPLSAVQASKTADSSADVPTDRHEGNTAKSIGVIEPPRATELMLSPGPPLQTPEEAKETAPEESDGILTSACTDHPVMLATLRTIERKKDVDQTNNPINDVRESANLAGDSKDMPPIDSPMDKESVIPLCLEVVKIGEMPVSVDGGRETALGNSNVDIRIAGCSHVAGLTFDEIQSLGEGCSAGALGIESTENQSSPGAATVSQAIHEGSLDDPDASNRKVETIREDCVVTNLCCISTMNEGVINENYVVLDLPLAGSSRVTDATIEKAQLLEEGCPTGDLGIEEGCTSSGDVIGEKYVIPDLPLPGFSHVVDPTVRKIQSLEEEGCSTGVLVRESTESLSSPGATAVSQVSEEESLGDPDANSRKSETLPGVDNTGSTMASNLNSSPAALSVTNLEYEQRDNVGCVAELGMEVGSISSSQNSVSYGAEVREDIQVQPQEPNSCCSTKLGTEMMSAYTSIDSKVQDAAALENAEGRPDDFAVVSQVALLLGGMAEVDKNVNERDTLRHGEDSEVSAVD